MKRELQSICELFVENKERVESAFKWESSTMATAGSMLFTAKGIRADVERLKECEKILKENTKLFSDFRGNVKIPFLCKMALSEQPLSYYRSVENIYKQMSRMKWSRAEYKIVAAMTIYDHVGDTDSQYYAERTDQIYTKMKEKHPWLTSDEDIPFAAILATTDVPIERLIDEVEKCFEASKETFKDGNARQTLSHVLALNEMPAEIKSQKTAEIWNRLKEEKHRFGSGYEIAVLGAIVSLEITSEEAARNIMDADEFLKTQKGCGNLSMRAETRRMLAALLVMNQSAPETCVMQQALLSSSLMLAIQMELCMIMLLTAIIVINTTNN